MNKCLNCGHECDTAFCCQTCEDEYNEDWSEDDEIDCHPEII